MKNNYEKWRRKWKRQEQRIFWSIVIVCTIVPMFLMWVIAYALLFLT